MNGFFNTLLGKIIALLAVVMMLLGIYIEMMTAWRVTSEAMSAAADAAAKTSTPVKIEPNPRDALPPQPYSIEPNKSGERRFLKSG